MDKNSPSPLLSIYGACYTLLCLPFLIYRGELDPIAAPLIKAAPILFLALIVCRHLPNPQWLWFRIALLFSAAGDILLETQFKLSFPLGLSAFLVAQLIYAYRFWQHRRPQTAYIKEISAMAGFAAVMLYLLLPHTGEMTIPVLFYMTAICTMGAGALAMQGSPLIKLGAISFIFSDSVIALNKFIEPFEAAGMVIMISYYLAQLLIVFGAVFTWKSELR
ncbi:MAG: lysoplasmalogenase [Cellvibrionaceae bacterium]|nr:lysoplasmalogenase [Cellvibrionaceae bacterium]